MELMQTLNLADIDSVEFGICFSRGKQHEHRLVPVDLSVQTALKEMLLATHERWERAGSASENYDPSQEYGGDRRLVLALQNHSVADEIKQL
jgi:hypothetical protein